MFLCPVFLFFFRMGRSTAPKIGWQSQHSNWGRGPDALKFLTSQSFKVRVRVPGWSSFLFRFCAGPLFWSVFFLAGPIFAERKRRTETQQVAQTSCTSRIFGAVRHVVEPLENRNFVTQSHHLQYALLRPSPLNGHDVSWLFARLRTLQTVCSVGNVIFF